jgi:phosphoglycerol transferase MdoB-like AlkP superfamily enzyme
MHPGTSASFRTSAPGLPRSLLGPLWPCAVLAAALALLFSAFRAGFVLAYLERLRAVPDFLEVLARGLRYDLITIALACAPLVLALLLLPAGAVRRLRPALAGYAVLAFVTALFFELASIGFLDEYDSRPNRLFLEYLERNDEVTAAVLKSYPVLVGVSVLALSAAGWLAWRQCARWLREPHAWSTGRRLLCLPLVLGLLGFAARGATLGRAFNRSTANYSSSHLANELVPNGLYTLACAAMDMRMERSPRDLYGDLPADEILARVRRWSGMAEYTLLDSALPTMHQPPRVASPPRPLNLVLVLEESMGAQFVARLGGRPVTPELEALAREGLWFERMYATGTRTVRGLEAVVCGFPPNPSASVVKLGLAQTGFFSMAALLARQGYATDYLYGGRSEFDNMEKFLRSSGFQSTFTQDDFTDPAFLGTWGVSDEDLFAKADEVFTAHGEQPFFALLLTTSNHTPFEFPDGRIELCRDASGKDASSKDASGKAEKATRDNAVKYADHALGEFFRRARTRAYFERTLFVVVADHDTRAPSDELLPLRHFHVPALILGPGVEPRVETRIASQIDLMPTALHLLGLSPAHPMPGRDLLALDESEPGRALLQYYNVNGFLTDGRLVVHQPFEPARHFRVQGDELEPVATDPELERDALAHVLLPWMLYEQRRYRLP